MLINSYHKKAGKIDFKTRSIAGAKEELLK
jgi:hypothetical protein